MKSHDHLIVAFSIILLLSNQGQIPLLLHQFLVIQRQLIDLDLQLMWDASMEVNSFDRTNAYISHYENDN